MVKLTQEYVRSLFDYKDGELYWKVSRGAAKIGDVAGNVESRGYRRIRKDGKIYQAHRLIFLYHHGYLPEFLDHIDGNPSNNDISNLREATMQENRMNSKKTEFVNGNLTSSKYKGVYYDKYHKRWRSQIMIDYKRKFLGYFDSEIDAALVYDKCAIVTFGKFANLNFD